MEDDEVVLAAIRIEHGEVVGFPTETVYGLGANALSAEAVEKIYTLKGRPSDNPCIVHIADEHMLHQVAKDIPDEAKPLMKKFWPGPLTLVLQKKPAVPDVVTAGLPTVAVRVPSHPVALELVRKAGVPIAAPSANISGKPSPTTAAHVREDFPNILVMDGGPCEKGIESTVIAFNPPRVLRLGAVTLGELRKLVPEMTIAKPGSKAESPGMKHTHYAPAKPVILFNELSALQSYAKKHTKAVVLCQDAHILEFSGSTVLPLGETDKDVAQNLFNALRAAEEGDEILVLAVEKKGLGRAVMDRLERAATKIV